MANAEAPEEDWRELHSRLPLWCQHHRPAFLNALSAALQLRRVAGDHEGAGLHLFLAFYADIDTPTCLRFECIRRMKLVECAGNVRDRFARARRRADAQYRALRPTTAYGAGLVLLSIRHDAAHDYETTYPLYLELTRDSLRRAHVPYWPRLLGACLHWGRLVTPEVDSSTLQTILNAHARDPTIGGYEAHNWDFDLHGTPISDVASTYIALCVGGQYQYLMVNVQPSMTVHRSVSDLESVQSWRPCPDNL